MSTIFTSPDLAGRLAHAESRIARLEAKLSRVDESDDVIDTDAAAALVGMSTSGFRKLYARDAQLALCSFRPAASDRAPLKWSRAKLERWKAARS